MQTGPLTYSSSRSRLSSGENQTHPPTRVCMKQEDESENPKSISDGRPWPSALQLQRRRYFLPSARSLNPRKSKETKQ